jgi:hypothetical protein
MLKGLLISAEILEKSLLNMAGWLGYVGSGTTQTRDVGMAAIRKVGT